MSLKSNLETFGSVAKTFHWIIALGIIGMICVGLIMVDMEPSPLKWQIYGYHKATGLVLFALILLRLSWRLSNVTPKLPATLTPWHIQLARLSPIALYTLMIIMPISGFIMSDAGGHPISLYGFYTLPLIFTKNDGLSHLAQTTHKYAAFLFIGVIIAHVSAALYHHFILKNTILLRMLPHRFHRFFPTLKDK